MAQDIHSLPVAVRIFRSEANFVDDLQRYAERVGWGTAREVPIKFGRHTWGRIDLVLNPYPGQQMNGRPPRVVIVEAKLHIRSMSEMRRAVEQAHGYRDALGVPADAVVVAASIDCPLPENLLLERYGVHVCTGEQLKKVLPQPCETVSDRLKWSLKGGHYRSLTDPDRVEALGDVRVGAADVRCEFVTFDGEAYIVQHGKYWALVPLVQRSRGQGRSPVTGESFANKLQRLVNLHMK